MDKEDVVNIYNGILLCHKKNKIIPFVATWMDIEIVILNEVNREAGTFYGAPYMQNLKRHDTN